MEYLKIKVLENQTLKDISVQYYGSFEGIYEIIKINENITFDTQLQTGQFLFINKNVIDSEIKTIFDKKINKPATKYILGAMDNRIFDLTFASIFN
jgi:hypothetical protein